MKKSKYLILLPLLLASMVACGGTTTTSPTPSGNNSSTTSVTSNVTSTGSSVSSQNSTASSSSISSTPNLEDERAKDYAYEPHLTEKMPKISVTTPDGSNEFATKYNRQDKINGLIDYVDCNITTSNCDDAYVLDNVACEIKVRGNYTLEYAKKPLRLKFDKKQKMFGLNNDAKCKSWVLLADWKDRSMMNNATTFYLGNTLLASDGFYSSDFRYVEVELNGEYWGVYLLVEQQQANEYRMDLAEPEDDYTGTDIGYIVEYDGYYNLEDPAKGGDYSFTMNYNNDAPVTKLNGQTYTHHGNYGYTIKSDITSTNQVTFIKNFMDKTYRIMYEAAYNDKAYVFDDEFAEISETTELTPRQAVEAVVDVKSLANMYLIQEIACDADIAWSSFYMDANFAEGAFKKLTFEAPWDFDSAYGIKNGVVNSASGTYAANSTNAWMNILINEDWFKEIIKEKWAELVKYDVFEDILQYNIDATTLYKDQFVSEMERWPGKKYNNELTSQVNSLDTQAKAADYAYNWLKNRFNYINTMWGDGEDLFNKQEVIEGYDFYRYEAENATLSGGVTKKTGYNASNDGYLGNVCSSTQNNTMSYKVNSKASQQAQLYFGISKRNTSININDLFSISINGQPLEVEDKTIALTDGDSWHTWHRMFIADINLLKDENSIVITTKLSSESTNFDYIDIYASEALS